MIRTGDSSAGAGGVSSKPTVSYGRRSIADSIVDAALTAKAPSRLSTCWPDGASADPGANFSVVNNPWNQSVGYGLRICLASSKCFARLDPTQGHGMQSRVVCASEAAPDGDAVGAGSVAFKGDAGLLG